MIAIGWSWPDADLPEGVQVEPHDALALLGFPKSVAKDARARMALQLAVFESGADILPLPPTQALTLCQARAVQPTMLRKCLAAISGKSQFTLAVTALAEARDAPLDGRDWLVARKAQYDRTAAQQSALRQLCDMSNDTPPRTRNVRGEVQCDVLVPRADGPEFFERLHGVAKKLPAFDDARLVVSGPWPAYGFSEISEEIAA